MPVRKADAKWNGSLKEGAGELGLGSGAYRGPYDFGSRFEDGKATNPEELIGAAHAGCFTMAMTAAMGREGITPTELRTTATVHLGQGAAGLSITKIELVTRGRVPGIDDAKFKAFAEGARTGCVISRALAGVGEITLDAALDG